MSNQQIDHILSMKEVVKRTSLSRSSIYRRIKTNDFPEGSSLGGNRVGWRESAINQWLDRQMSSES